MLQRIILLFFLLTITTASVKAGDWIDIYSQDGVTYYINTDITADFDSYNVWIKQEYTTKAARSKILRDFKLKRTAFSKVTCFKYKTSWSEFAIKTFVFYSAKGDVIESLNNPYLEYNLVIPDTFGHLWAEVAKNILSMK